MKQTKKKKKGRHSTLVIDITKNIDCTIFKTSKLPYLIQFFSSSSKQIGLLFIEFRGKGL